jgi:Integral membrane protein possibly involved in chromosome condensation
MMYFMIAVGGAFGAMSRFALGKWISSYWNHAFPLATFSINVLGSFLMGVVFILITEKWPFLRAIVHC